MIKIARIAVTLGLLSSLGAQAYAAGLVVNDNDLRNDLAWLSDRGVIHLSLSTWPLSQEEIARALKKAKPSYSSEQVVLARINQRLSALKADFRVTGYTSTCIHCRVVEIKLCHRLRDPNQSVLSRRRLYHLDSTSVLQKA